MRVSGGWSDSRDLHSRSQLETDTGQPRQPSKYGHLRWVLQHCIAMARPEPQVTHGMPPLADVFGPSTQQDHLRMRLGCLASTVTQCHVTVSIRMTSLWQSPDCGSCQKAECHFGASHGLVAFGPACNARPRRREEIADSHMTFRPRVRRCGLLRHGCSFL